MEEQSRHFWAPSEEPETRRQQVRAPNKGRRLFILRLLLRPNGGWSRK